MASQNQHLPAGVRLEQPDVLSSPAVATCDPSGLMATSFTAAECPASVASLVPLPVSQTSAVPSKEAAASRVPVGSKATWLVWVAVLMVRRTSFGSQAHISTCELSCNCEK